MVAQTKVCQAALHGVPLILGSQLSHVYPGFSDAMLVAILCDALS